jgi:hypothetical protein
MAYLIDSINYTARRLVVPPGAHPVPAHLAKPQSFCALVPYGGKVAGMILRVVFGWGGAGPVSAGA